MATTSAAKGNWTRNWGAGRQDGPNFAGPAEAGRYAVTFDEDAPRNPSLTLLAGGADQCGVGARFVCENGHTEWGTSVYLVGNLPALGDWDPARGLLMRPYGRYPTWNGNLTGLPPATAIEWKFIKRRETGTPPPVILWQPGDNNRFQTPANGDAGSQVGRF